MGIRIKKMNVVYNSFNYEAINPRYVFLDREGVKKYVELYPFPEVEGYKEEDLINDTRSEGMWTLPDCVTEEQEEYIKEMVRHFL